MDNNYYDNLLENAILELYFEDNEDIKIYKESMDELIKEEYEEYLLNESKLTKEEKEARKKKKLEERIQKAKEKTIKRITAAILNDDRFEKFELDTHVSTPKERALFIARNSAIIGTSAGISGTTSKVIINAADGVYKGARFIPTAAATGISAGANIAAYTMVCASIGLITELIKNARYKEIYSVKLYGIKKDGSKKLVQWWTTVRVEISDLPSAIRSKVSRFSK